MVRNSPVTSFLRDTRGSYSQVSYTLALGITILLMSMILTSTGAFVNNTTDNAAQMQLSIIGDRIATKIMAIDQQAAEDSDLTVTLDVEVPKTASGTHYMVKIQNGPPDGTDYLLLYSVQEAASVKIPLYVSYEVSEATIASDEDLVIERERGVIRLGVKD